MLEVNRPVACQKGGVGRKAWNILSIFVVIDQPLQLEEKFI